MATHDGERTRPTTSAEAWGLAYPGLGMSTDGGNTVSEFTGMWPLKPDADLVHFTKVLAPGGWPDPPGESFSERMTLLGLIRTARWFVAKTPYFPEHDNDGYTLFFISQFDSTLEKYFDDFVLNGKPNLAAIWGKCIGCPTGPDATARDIVEYIARGQIKTLACLRRRFRGSASARSTRRLTGTRRRRSSSVRLPRATANSRTRSTPSCRSWPSRTSQCRAAPPSTRMSASEWQYDGRRRISVEAAEFVQMDRPRHSRGLADSTLEDHDDEHSELAGESDGR